ncbi:MAG: hypothetical protein JNN26_20740 [Candidatus Obscuribacter sp.]|nr:hypothetical protein [Candidatus Obscuribacter sp.]
MLRVQSIVLLLFLCVVYGQCFPWTALAGASYEKRQVKRPGFFPYNSCILVKIDNIRRATAKDCCHRSEVIAKVTVKSVLRGNFAPGEKLSIAIEDDDAEYLLNGNGISVEKLVGQTSLLAFNRHRFDTSRGKGCHLRVSNLYFPLIGAQITDTAVAELQQSLQTAPYPYKSCVVCTILDIADRKIGYGSKKTQRPFCIVRVRIDEILLDNRSNVSEPVTPDIHISRLKSRRLKVGESILCNLGSNPSESIFPKCPRSDLSGTRCIWSFNPVERFLEQNEPVLNLAEVSAPFPYQVYGSKDVESLKARLALDSDKYHSLVEDVHAYVMETCTIDRLRRFCQPENRCSGSFQKFPCVSDNEILYAQFFDSRSGAKGSESAFSNATWFADVVDGVPRAYEVLIDQGGPNRWIFHAPFRLRASADELVRERIFQTLHFGILNYKQRHHSDGLDTGLKGILLIPPGKLLRDSDQRIVGFRCCLNNGRALQIGLDENLKIRDISVSGNLGKAIRQALETTVENWDWCWAQRGGGNGVMTPGTGSSTDGTDIHKH